MKLPLQFRRNYWPRFITAMAAIGLFHAFAHEPTRRAHEAALDPRERMALASARGLAGVAPTAVAAVPVCQLNIRLLDSVTRELLPGLVRITQADGSALPLVGLVSRGTKLRTGHPAKDWFALLESATVPVPQARLVIEVFSGLQTELARVTVDLSGKQSVQVELPLTSFARVADAGWFGGNTHLHLSGLTREQADEYLRTLPRADGLDLVFVSHLERAQADRDYISNGYKLADLQRLGGQGLIFGNGEEHRHNFDGFGEGYGHVMFLNIRQLVQPVSIGRGIMGEGPDWPPLRHGITQARGDGATVIWCHNTFGHEDAPNWLAGFLHAHNIFDGDGATHGSYEDTFYRYLNIGLKVPFSTGTDWFIYDFARVYARLVKDTALTVPNWLSALTSGRTFISNGPLLEFHVGKAEIGDTIPLSKRELLSVSGRAVGRHEFKRLELVHNGKVVHSVTNRAVGEHFEAALDLTLTANEPGWVALRVPTGGAKNEMDEPTFAHTSPIYIEFGGKRVLKRDAADALLLDMESALKVIPAKARFVDDAQRDELLKIYRDGIGTLRQRISE